MERYYACRDDREAHKFLAWCHTDLHGEDGSPILHTVITRGDLKGARILVQRGARLELRDCRGRTALNQAAFVKNLPIFELLLASGARVSQNTAEDACRAQSDAFLRLVNERAPLCAMDNARLLATAAQHSHAAMMYLLELGFDHTLVYDGNTALHYAAAAGNADSVRALLARGLAADALNQHGHTPLHCVAQNRHAKSAHETVAALVQAGADVNKPAAHGQNTPLHYAAQMRNAAGARALVDLGASLAAKGALGRTPL